MMLPHTYSRDDPLGLRHDTLVGALGEVQTAKNQLQDVYVALDAVADDREGIWTPPERSELRMMQATVQALLEACDENEADIRAELDAVREQMG